MQHKRSIETLERLNVETLLNEVLTPNAANAHFIVKQWREIMAINKPKVIDFVFYHETNAIHHNQPYDYIPIPLHLLSLVELSANKTHETLLIKNINEFVHQPFGKQYCQKRIKIGLFEFVLHLYPNGLTQPNNGFVAYFVEMSKMPHNVQYIILYRHLFCTQTRSKHKETVVLRQGDCDAWIESLRSQYCKTFEFLQFGAELEILQIVYHSSYPTTEHYVSSHLIIDRGMKYEYEWNSNQLQHILNAIHRTQHKQKLLFLTENTKDDVFCFGIEYDPQNGGNIWIHCKLLRLPSYLDAIHVAIELQMNYKQLFTFNYKHNDCSIKLTHDDMHCLLSAKHDLSLKIYLKILDEVDMHILNHDATDEPLCPQMNTNDKEWDSIVETEHMLKKEQKYLLFLQNHSKQKQYQINEEQRMLNGEMHQINEIMKQLEIRKHRVEFKQSKLEMKQNEVYALNIEIRKKEQRFIAQQNECYMIKDEIKGENEARQMIQNRKRKQVRNITREIKHLIEMQIEEKTMGICAVDDDEVDITEMDDDAIKNVIHRMMDEEISTISKTNSTLSPSLHSLWDEHKGNHAAASWICKSCQFLNQTQTANECGLCGYRNIVKQMVDDDDNNNTKNKDDNDDDDNDDDDDEDDDDYDNDDNDEDDDDDEEENTSFISDVESDTGFEENDVSPQIENDEDVMIDFDEYQDDSDSFLFDECNVGPTCNAMKTDETWMHNDQHMQYVHMISEHELFTSEDTNQCSTPAKKDVLEESRSYIAEPQVQEHVIQTVDTIVIDTNIISKHNHKQSLHKQSAHIQDRDNNKSTSNNTICEVQKDENEVKTPLLPPKEDVSVTNKHIKAPQCASTHTNNKTSKVTKNATHKKIQISNKQRPNIMVSKRKKHRRERKKKKKQRRKRSKPLRKKKKQKSYHEKEAKSIPEDVKSISSSSTETSDDFRTRFKEMMDLFLKKKMQKEKLEKENIEKDKMEKENAIRNEPQTKKVVEASCGTMPEIKFTENETSQTESIPSEPETLPSSEHKPQLISDSKNKNKHKKQPKEKKNRNKHRQNSTKMSRNTNTKKNTSVQKDVTQETPHTHKAEDLQIATINDMNPYTSLVIANRKDPNLDSASAIEAKLNGIVDHVVSKIPTFRTDPNALCTFETLASSPAAISLLENMPPEAIAPKKRVIKDTSSDTAFMDDIQSTDGTLWDKEANSFGRKADALYRKLWKTDNYRIFYKERQEYLAHYYEADESMTETVRTYFETEIECCQNMHIVKQSYFAFKDCAEIILNESERDTARAALIDARTSFMLIETAFMDASKARKTLPSECAVIMINLSALTEDIAMYLECITKLHEVDKGRWKREKWADDRRKARHIQRLLRESPRIQNQKRKLENEMKHCNYVLQTIQKHKDERAIKRLVAEAKKGRANQHISTMTHSDTVCVSEDDMSAFLSTKLASEYVCAEYKTHDFKFNVYIFPNGDNLYNKGYVQFIVKWVETPAVTKSVVLHMKLVEKYTNTECRWSKQWQVPLLLHKNNRWPFDILSLQTCAEHKQLQFEFVIDILETYRMDDMYVNYCKGVKLLRGNEWIWDIDSALVACIKQCIEKEQHRMFYVQHPKHEEICLLLETVANDDNKTQLNVSMFVFKLAATIQRMELLFEINCNASNNMRRVEKHIFDYDSCQCEIQFTDKQIESLLAGGSFKFSVRVNEIRLWFKDYMRTPYVYYTNKAEMKVMKQNSNKDKWIINMHYGKTNKRKRKKTRHKKNGNRVRRKEKRRKDDLTVMLAEKQKEEEDELKKRFNVDVAFLANKNQNVLNEMEKTCVRDKKAAEAELKYIHSLFCDSSDSDTTNYNKHHQCRNCCCAKCLKNIGQKRVK